MRQVGTEDWLPATVPGGVHTDLLAAGPSAIIGTGVRLTVIGGRIVHRSEG